jgi:hypothetical protein
LPVKVNFKQICRPDSGVRIHYAKAREECEKLLEEMIPKVRAEIKAEKDRLKSQNETAQV